MFWNEYTPDYVAIVATQMAILAQADEPKPTIKPALPNCPKCKGTGKIKTGDGISWTNCPCTERAADCVDGNCRK